LVNLVEGSLHSTGDYIKALENIFNVPELKAYLEKFILVAPMDYPGQIHVRPEQIIRQAKIIDQSRGSNIFKENFSDSHNITFSETELDFMKKRAAIYLLELCTDVYNNIGKTVIDTS
ncbi:8589_t:CDS:2, partial [Entrophospora sp. SA101]